MHEIVNGLTDREVKILFKNINENVPSMLSVRKMQIGRKKYFDFFEEMLTETKISNRSFTRFLIADYGSGKTHLVDGLVDKAKGDNFLVSKIDLAPNRLLYHSEKAIATYNLIMSNLTCKGTTNAIETLFTKIIQDSMKGSTDNQNIIDNVHQNIKFLENLPQGTIFVNITLKYTRAYLAENEVLKSNCVRWLKGEYNNKTVIRQELNIDAIITSSNYNDYLNLITQLAKRNGYNGLAIFIDECVNIKDSHHTTRKKNYETILNIYNETSSGEIDNMIYFFIGDEEFLVSEKIGLFSYEAIKTRLEQEDFDFVDLHKPVWRLPSLEKNDQVELCKFISSLYSRYHQLNNELVDQNHINNFIEELNSGFDENHVLTRTIISKFTQRLNKIVDNNSTPDELFGIKVKMEEHVAQMEQYDF